MTGRHNPERRVAKQRAAVITSNLSEKDPEIKSQATADLGGGPMLQPIACELTWSG